MSTAQIETIRTGTKPMESSPVLNLKSGKLQLLRDQFFRGQCILISNASGKELHDLPEDDRMQLLRDLSLCSAVLMKALGADKINIGAFNDECDYFFFYLTPKYVDAPGWGVPFTMVPSFETILCDSERIKMIEDIQETFRRLS